MSSVFDSLWRMIIAYNIKPETIDMNICCTICHEVMCNAYISYCECQFCKVCLDDYLDGSIKRCPGIKKECSLWHNLVINENVFPDNKANFKIFKLIVKCPNDNCECKLEYGKIEDHLRVCEASTTECLYKGLGCEWKKKRDTVFLHLQYDNVSHAKLVVDKIVFLSNDLNSLRDEFIEAKLINPFNTQKDLSQNIDNEDECLKPSFKVLPGDDASDDCITKIVNDKMLLNSASSVDDVPSQDASSQENPSDPSEFEKDPTKWIYSFNTPEDPVQNTEYGKKFLAPLLCGVIIDDASSQENRSDPSGEQENPSNAAKRGEPDKEENLTTSNGRQQRHLLSHLTQSSSNSSDNSDNNYQPHRSHDTSLENVEKSSDHILESDEVVSEEKTPARCNSDDCKVDEWSSDETNWVQCDVCEGWYHCLCVGIKSDIEIMEEDSFMCASCNCNSKHGLLGDVPLG